MDQELFKVSQASPTPQDSELAIWKPESQVPSVLVKEELDTVISPLDHDESQDYAFDFWKISMVTIWDSSGWIPTSLTCEIKVELRAYCDSLEAYFNFDQYKRDGVDLPTWKTKVDIGQPFRLLDALEFVPLWHGRTPQSLRWVATAAAEFVPTLGRPTLSVDIRPQLTFPKRWKQQVIEFNFATRLTVTFPTLSFGWSGLEEGGDEAEWAFI